MIGRKGNSIFLDKELKIWQTIIDPSGLEEKA